MMQAIQLAAALVVVLATAVRVNAAPIMLDVDAIDAPASETQAGFTRMTAIGMTGNGASVPFSPTATVNGVTVTASTTQGFRDRGISPSGTLPPPPVPNVLRDFIFADQTIGSAEISVTIESLPVGLYAIRTFHHDWNVGSVANMFSIFTSDASGANQLKVSGASYSNSDLFDNGQLYFVQSNGTDDILIRIVGDPHGVNNLSGVRFNGISIAAVPEPSSLALLATGAIGLIGYRRRKRKLAE